MVVRLQGQALLPFYAGGYPTDSRSCYLVLEDVSKSHILNPRLDEPDWFRSEYTLQSAQQIVDGFAQVHSHFWGDAQLGLTMGIHPEENLLPDEGDIMGGYAYDRGPTPIAEYARIQNRRAKTKRLRAIRS